jgi:predicted phosphodiesterase
MPYNKAPICANPFVYEHIGEDVVVLAGDIHTQGRHHELIQAIVPHAKVIMIAGNHEAYGASFQAVHENLKEIENTHTNFFYLNDSNVVIDDVDFFGGIMYTNIQPIDNIRDIDSLCKRYIPDFSVITKEARLEDFESHEGFINFSARWTTNDHRKAHQKFCKELGYWKLSSNFDKKVVISHFVPTYKAVAPQFKNSALNSYFIENMEHTMNGVDLWLFGHTHTSFDFMIDDTRLVSNPYGYRDENKDGFIVDKILEI